MKSLATFLLMLLSLKVVAFSPLELPKDRMDLTPLSSRIVLIEVTGVKFATAKQEFKGIETRQFTVEGRVLEVIRGALQSGPWKHSGSVSEEVDPTLFRETYDYAADVIRDGFRYLREGSDCKRGERYLVVYWKEQPFFVRIERGGSSWRKRIKDMDGSHPFCDPKPNLHNKPLRRTDK